MEKIALIEIGKSKLAEEKKDEKKKLKRIKEMKTN